MSTTQALSPAAILSAAHNLTGATLDGGWTVKSKVAKHHSATGGTFSISYIVEDANGKQAFLKVLDLGRAFLMGGDQLKQIESLIKQFNFERETLRVCRAHRLKRIASAIADGKLDAPGNPYGVYYIIFDLAQGDIRKQISTLASIDLAWILRTLHQIAVGLAQLHRKDIAHQDLKPSNVLVYGPRDSKIADLGCADLKKSGSPRGVFEIAGDLAYAPPELLYGDISPDWEKRRLGTDMYLFGSLIAFLFTHVSMTHAIQSYTHFNHQAGKWPHDYRTVLPFVRDAFGRTMADIRAALPESIRADVAGAVEKLCDPDPNLRGEQRGIHSSQFDFSAFVSLFDRLAKRAELGMLKS